MEEQVGMKYIYPALALFGGVAAILLVDLWFYLRGGYEATITAWVKASRLVTAVVAFLLGCLFGHLFL